MINYLQNVMFYFLMGFVTVSAQVVHAEAAAVPDPQTELVKAKEVCEKWAEYLMFKGVHEPILTHNEDSTIYTKPYVEFVKEFEKLPNEALDAVAKDEKLSFLARRVAAAKLCVRQHERKDTKKDSGAAFSVQAVGPRTIEKSRVKLLERTANKEYRLSWEFGLLNVVMSPNDLSLRALAIIKDPESLPLLESYYEWNNYRLKEIGCDQTARKKSVDVIRQYHTVEALETLCRLWTKIASSEQDKADILDAIAKDKEWIEVLASLSKPQQEKMTDFLKKIKAQQTIAIPSEKASQK